MTLPKVLVLLATYNGHAWIIEQIQSVLNQIEVDVRILIRDDLSTDGTVQLIESIYSCNSKINLVCSLVSSGSAGINFQKLISDADLMNIDYVAFCDQDDKWYPSKLKDAINCISRNSANGYSSAVNATWESGKVKILRQSPNTTDIDYLFEGAGQGCTFVIPVKEFTLVKKFCSDHKKLVADFYYHDWLTYLIIRVSGGKWYFDQKPSMSYRQHGGNDTGARHGFFSIIKRFSLIRRGWYKNQIKIAILIATKAGYQHNNNFHVFSKIFFKKAFMFRKIYLATFCLRGGRRRMLDNLVLFFSVLMGWI